MSKNKRSPLKDKPLRNPGQSLEELKEKMFDDILQPLVIAVMAVVLAVMEWLRYFNPAPPSPKLYTAIAIISLGYIAWRLRTVLPKLRQITLAIQGEKAVGQYLERLREKGYQVFHDVIGDKFNIDHVIVGSAGVFTVETKTRSKPDGRQVKVEFDGERILVDGFESERDAVIQARAQAGWLKDILKESTGRTIEVFPVVVFPGWFVEQQKGASRRMWVLEPKALPAFLDHQPAVLLPEDVKLMSFHLSQFIRAAEVRASSN